MPEQYTYLLRTRDKGDPWYLKGATGLKLTQALPGGFINAEFSIPYLGPSEAQYLGPLNRITISKGPVTLFDGEIRESGEEWTAAGKRYRIAAYGHGVLLKDDFFGPHLYADNRLDIWKEYNPTNAPIYSSDIVPDKFTAQTDKTILRIAAKPDVVYQSLGGSSAGDAHTLYYELPKVGGSYVSESIKEVKLTYQTAFPTGQWVFQIWEWDGTSAALTTVSTATITATTYTFTPTLANCKAVGIALKANQDQAVYNGTIEDGEGETAVSHLEYAGSWGAQLNSPAYPTLYSGDGEMVSVDRDSLTSRTKSNDLFYPSGTTARTGAAVRLKFQGRSIGLYAQQWGDGGKGEIEIWDSTGGSVLSTYADFWNAGVLTGTLTCTAASSTISGVGTKFNDELAAGDKLAIFNRAGAYDAANRTFVEIVSIGSSLAMVVKPPVTFSMSGASVNRRLFQKQAWSKQLSSFGSYTLIMRHIGNSTSATAAGSTLINDYIHVDYFNPGVVAMDEFKDGAISLEVSNVMVRTSSAGVVTNAALVASDLISRYSTSAIGLSSSTAGLNDAGAGLPDLEPLVFDDPVTGDQVLETICAPGTTNKLPLDWWVFEERRLEIGERDVSGRYWQYYVEADQAVIRFDKTVQDDFGLVVAPIYQDQSGERFIGSDVTSTRITDDYQSRKRRIVLPTEANSSAAAAAISSVYLQNHDLPSKRVSLTLNQPLRDQGGALVPLDEVRVGRLLTVRGSLDERGPMGSTDLRGGLSDVITGLTWDHEAQTLEVDLGEGPATDRQFIANLKRERDRDQRAL